MKKTNYADVIGKIVGAIVILVLLVLLSNSNNKHKELLRLNAVTSEELQLSRNEQGELVVKMSAFETQRTKDFLKFATKDSLTIELQKDVREMKKYLKKQGSVTQFSTEGNVETVAVTEVDTITSENPIYKSSFNLGNWVFGSSKATIDSTSYNIGYRDNYSLVIGLEPQGFLGLGKGKVFGQVTSSNPYNTVKTLKTYQVSLPKQKRFGIGPNISIAPLLENGKLVIQPTVGVGVQYNFIKF